MSDYTLNEEDIQHLNDYQEKGLFHPYTCGNQHCREDLVPTENKWICLKCNYMQTYGQGELNTIKTVKALKLHEKEARAKGEWKPFLRGFYNDIYNETTTN